jgi:hypothetical protein
VSDPTDQRIAAVFVVTASITHKLSKGDIVWATFIINDQSRLVCCKHRANISQTWNRVVNVWEEVE